MRMTTAHISDVRRDRLNIVAPLSCIQNTHIKDTVYWYLSENNFTIRKRLFKPSIYSFIISSYRQLDYRKNFKRNTLKLWVTRTSTGNLVLTKLNEQYIFIYKSHCSNTHSVTRPKWKIILYLNKVIAPKLLRRRKLTLRTKGARE